MALEGPFEIAMTQTWVGGQRQSCPRPDDVRSIANRVHRWKDVPETCQSCLASPAVALVARTALCSQCRDQRNLRHVGVEMLDRQVLETRSDLIGGPGFRGYSIVFGAKSLDLGGFEEVIAPSAVNRTLHEQIDVRALWNHNSDVTLGRVSARTLMLKKDTTGLLASIVPPAWAGPQMETVDRGDVTGQSFGFRTIEDEWSYEGRMPLRTVADMRISEISGVAFPAYVQTTLRVERENVRARSVQMAGREHRTRMAR